MWDEDMEKLHHSPGDAEEWNESYYFNFYDPREDIGGFTRTGFKPNKKEGVGYLYLFYKGKILSFTSSMEISEIPEKIRVRPLEFCPGWSVTFAGTMNTNEGSSADVTVNLKYSPINEEFSYLKYADETQREVAKVTCEDHYEQIGIMKGEIIVNSKKYVISGFSERDHSWGVRDWNAPYLWIYITAHFNENFAITIAKVLINTHEADGGFIMKEGRNIPVKKVVPSVAGKEPIQPQFEYTVYDSEGTSYVLTGEILKTVQIPYKKGDKISILNENLSQFHCKDMKGFGIAEYLLKIK